MDPLEHGNRPLLAIPGLTLRDWFAGMALDAIISKGPRQRVEMGSAEDAETEVARGAYAYADAMISVRGESGQ